MSTRNRIILYFLGITISVLSVLVIYGLNKYTLLESRIQSIQISCNEDISYKGLPTLYLSGASEPNLNFGKPYKFTKTSSGVYQAKLDDSLNARSFRFYFEYPGEKVEISDLALLTAERTYHIDLGQKRLDLESIKRLKHGDAYVFEVLKMNGHLSSPKQYIYPSDFKGFLKLVIPVLSIIALLTLIVFNLKRYDLKSWSLSEWSLGIFILTIFLPAPIYNVALILIVILNIQKVNFKKIFGQKINLIFISFFMMYLINNLFISEEAYNSMSTIERFLPFLIIPIIIPGIVNRKFLILFPVSAIILGFGLLVTSILDVFIHGNMSFLSFDNFSKYLHPVYYSYLLFFSVIFIQHGYHGRMKALIQLLLFCFLIFSGSKMVLIFTLLTLIITMLKSKKAILVIGVIIGVMVLFSPLSDRFKTIFNAEDLSVLNETHIENHNDARINGLTFRLILWREALATMNGVDFILGKGVTETAEVQLEQRMQILGLEKHQNYNPHNQFVDTFWRTGIIGLLFLILMPGYSLFIGIKRKDRLVIQFSLFMLAVMCSESIFGRVNGVYFFTTVILILINTKKIDENSDIRY